MFHLFPPLLHEGLNNWKICFEFSSWTDVLTDARSCKGSGYIFQDSDHQREKHRQSKFHQLIYSTINIWFCYVSITVSIISCNSWSLTTTKVVIHEICLYFFQVQSFVKLNGIHYAGSHGMDIKGPKNSDQVFLFGLCFQKLNWERKFVARFCD